jgi:hypothetical protein
MLEFLKNPKNPAPPEMLPNLEMIARDVDSPALARILAMELMGYSSVDYALSVISVYDLVRLTSELEVVLDAEELPEDDISEMGVCYEVSVMAMVMSTAEGTFGDFLELSPLELIIRMHLFMSIELYCRLNEEDYPELPSPTFSMDKEDVEKLINFIYPEDKENE